MMTGLRTREPLGFEKFMEKVQQAAETKGCVFFLDSKEGHEQVKNGLIASDCSGWLVPIGEAEEFNAEYMDFASVTAGISISHGKRGMRTQGEIS